MAWQILYRRNGHWLPGKTHQQKKDATEPPPALDVHYSKGFTDQSGDCGKFEAGINVGTWMQRIVAYGDTAEDAERMRDVILEALARPAQTEQAPAQDEREAFESWYLGDTGFGPESLTRDAHGDYVDPDAVSCWEGWQARAKRPAQTGQQPVLSNCLDLVEKMTVSVDVSTGDDDAFNRLFCKVAGVQEESDGSWTILAVDPEPNFAAPIAQTAPRRPSSSLSR